jgi:uncharacterized protein (DUF2147 family)
MRLRLNLRGTARWGGGMAVAAWLAAWPGLAGAASTPVGTWLTEDHKGVIAIAPCGGGLCGRIVGMSEPLRPDGSRPVDNQGRPQCGLTILQAAAGDQPGQWQGKITDPLDGSVWNCELSLDGEGRLHLRGYVLLPLLGQTQLWTPYTGHVTQDCRME